MTKEELKQRCLQQIDKNQQRIISLGEELYKTPELGYKEFQTTKRMEQALASTGLPVDAGIVYTGCCAKSSKKEGPTVAVLGELDCLVCKEHPDAISNGNVHACGHNVQLANLFGCAAGLAASGALQELGGSVKFIAIPAEECLDFEYRDSLIKKKEIAFFGGKQEYLRRGGFDDVDMVLQCHMMPLEKGKSCVLNTDCDGFMAKTVRFIGKAAHAGFSPFNGINALNMAELALNNIHALRETFKEEDKIRVSAVITHGGDVVNVVPSSVTMQIMVRAFHTQSMLESGKKIDRAVKAGAFALGGQVEIQDRIGYLPLKTDRNLTALYRQNMVQYGGAAEDSFIDVIKTAGSTDLGDISHLKPCMHIWSSGVTGGLHTKDYRIADLQKAYILPTKMLALTTIDLLYGKAEQANAILKGYHPSYTKEDYLAFMEEHSRIDFFNGAMV